MPHHFQWEEWAYSIILVPMFYPVQKMVYFGETYFQTIALHISSLMNASETLGKLKNGNNFY